MSVHKNPNTHIDKISKAVPRKAPMPKVDREHHDDMRRLERDPGHIDKQFGGDPKGGVRTRSNHTQQKISGPGVTQHPGVRRQQVQQRPSAGA